MRNLSCLLQRIALYLRKEKRSTLFSIDRHFVPGLSGPIVLLRFILHIILVILIAVLSSVKSVRVVVVRQLLDLGLVAYLLELLLYFLWT